MEPFSLAQLLSKNMDDLTLSELQGLKKISILNVVSFHFETVLDRDDEEPTENQKNLVKLIDDYLLWAVSHRESYTFHDFKQLLESIPSKVRDNCDTLYSVVDALVKRYQTSSIELSEGDLVLLSGFLDPFKMTEKTIESAINNSLIPLQPQYFTALYFVQKMKIYTLEQKVEKMESEIAKIKEAVDLSEKEIKKDSFDDSSKKEWKKPNLETMVATSIADSFRFLLSEGYKECITKK